MFGQRWVTLTCFLSQSESVSPSAVRSLAHHVTERYWTYGPQNFKNLWIGSHSTGNKKMPRAFSRTSTFCTFTLVPCASLLQMPIPERSALGLGENLRPLWFLLGVLNVQGFPTLKLFGDCRKSATLHVAGFLEFPCLRARAFFNQHHLMCAEDIILYLQNSSTSFGTLLWPKSRGTPMFSGFASSYFQKRLMQDEQETAW